MAQTGAKVTGRARLRSTLSSEEGRLHRADIEARAGAWTLLLQLDLADWTQADLADGTVCFLIRAADLAARDFEA